MAIAHNKSGIKEWHGYHSYLSGFQQGSETMSANKQGGKSNQQGGKGSQQGGKGSQQGGGR